MIAVLAERRQVANDERVAGRYAAAETILVAAIEAASTALEASDLMVAVLRNDLAVTYKSAGRLAEAEALYWPALAVFESTLGPSTLRSPSCGTTWAGSVTPAVTSPAPSASPVAG